MGLGEGGREMIGQLFVSKCRKDDIHFFRKVDVTFSAPILRRGLCSWRWTVVGNGRFLWW
jgi:hypothetical protein